MKYIRTKDGTIFDVSGICIPYQVVDGWIDFNSQGRFKIVKQSDNIVELADYLLFKFKVEKKMVGAEIEEAAILEGLKSFMIDGSLDFARLLIFIGKDLKCVAEMNEKGEWRLI